MYKIKEVIKKKTPNVKQNRFLSIAKLSASIFNIDDLARIWGIDNRNILTTTLKRYIESGLMYRLYRGLYTIKPAPELDSFFIGDTVNK